MIDFNRMPLSELTPEEIAATYFVGQGFWGPQLAEQLSMPPEEADRLVDSTMSKLGVDGRLDLWIYAKAALAESPMAHA